MDINSEVIYEGVPVQINLSLPGDPRSTIGKAKVLKNADETYSIELFLTKEASPLVENFLEAVELKALGFAGIVRDPERWRPKPITPDPMVKQ